MPSPQRTPLIRSAHCLRFAALLVLLACVSTLRAQEGFHTETSTGVTNIRIAVADFKPVSSDPQSDTLKGAFDTTLYTDLANAGIFDIVSKSLLPQTIPGVPADMNVQQWSAAPVSAARYQSRRKFITRFLVSARVSERARPSFLMTRSTEMARTDSDWTQLGPRSPLSGPIGTWMGNPLCRLVTAATINCSLRSSL